MSETLSDEREDWVRLSLRSLARAYGDDEPEYSRNEIKKANAEYEQAITNVRKSISKSSTDRSDEIV